MSLKNILLIKKWRIFRKIPPTTSDGNSELSLIPYFSPIASFRQLLRDIKARSSIHDGILHPPPDLVSHYWLTSSKLVLLFVTSHLHPPPHTCVCLFLLKLGHTQASVTFLILVFGGSPLPTKSDAVPSLLMRVWSQTSAVFCLCFGTGAPNYSQPTLR